MINIILLAVYSFVSFIIGIFPNSTGLPETIHDAATSIGGYLGIISPIAPLDILFQCVSLIITVEILIFSFKGLRWVISHIPMIGGRA